MSRSYQKICFNLDADLVESILRFVVLPEGCDFSYFVKCMFINRCISKGYLDEFGSPVELPTLDFEGLEIGSINSALEYEKNVNIKEK